MKVKFDISAVGQSKWYEYVLRFIFGGFVTAMAGVLAKRYGPEFGGLFLAFPAIFPAAATLIKKHEQEKEGYEKDGDDDGKKSQRGTIAAGLDALGSSFGAVGLIVFAVIVWRMLPDSRLSIVLPIATLAWAATSVLLWITRERFRIHARLRRRRFSHAKLNSVITATPSSPRRIR